MNVALAKTENDYEEMEIPRDDKEIDSYVVKKANPTMTSPAQKGRGNRVNIDW